MPRGWLIGAVVVDHVLFCGPGVMPGGDIDTKECRILEKL